LDCAGAVCVAIGVATFVQKTSVAFRTKYPSNRFEEPNVGVANE
jgi:hypothetical protein